MAAGFTREGIDNLTLPQIRLYADAAMKRECQQELKDLCLHSLIASGDGKAMERRANELGKLL
jgi:hypothetical protein